MKMVLNFQIKKILLVLLIPLLFGCAFQKGQLIEATGEELIEKYENKEDFIFLIARTDCPKCNEYLDNLKGYIKDNEVTFFYIEADKDENIKSFDILWKTYFPEIELAPTTFYVKEGINIDSVTGIMDNESIDTWFKRIKDK